MTKEEAVKALLQKSIDINRIDKNLSQEESFKLLLDFIEDAEEGLGMYPPMTKKGKFEWSQEDNQEQTGTK